MVRYFDDRGKKTIPGRASLVAKDDYDALEAKLAEAERERDEARARVKALEEALPDYVTNCCVCGRIVDKREADDGGDPFGCELPGSKWACSFECWDASIPALAPVEKLK